MSRHSTKTRFPVVLILAVPLMLVGYVLSIGPAWSLAVRRQIDEEAYERFYAPVLWGHYHSETYSRLLQAYVVWWNDHLPGG